jgi:hypothetical protein
MTEMDQLKESWKRAIAHLQRAEIFLGCKYGLTEYRDHLQHNELELAADQLFSIGEADEALGEEFWAAMSDAYKEMGVGSRKLRCGLWGYGARVGFFEASLELTTTQSGGRRTPVLGTSEYRYMCVCDVGNRQDGETIWNDAAVILKEQQALAPGETGVVRLYAVHPEAWERLLAGDVISLHEGKSKVGSAKILRVVRPIKPGGPGLP